ncbi:MAG: propanediol utilization protein [Rhodobacteraceae bacterium]|nr:propanediol utilization protein [Paracoccaceae bacterium]
MRPEVRIAGHFGEFLQGRLGADGPLVLVTVPCPDLGVFGWQIPGREFALHGSGQRLVTPDRARRFLRDLGADLPGRVVLRAEMPAGSGAGASTATLLALAALAGAKADPMTIARACIGTEGASDPLMFSAPERILWASRQGLALGAMPCLPRIEILGGFVGPARRTDPGDENFPDVSDLVAGWRDIASPDDLAAIASESSRRTLALRGIGPDPTEALAHDMGALGFLIAHTGSARGLIFRPGAAPGDWRGRLRQAGFANVLKFRVGEYACSP